MELWFRNEASISIWSFEFKMELQFWNWELRFQNGALILKWSYDFKTKLWFQNGPSISKSRFNFEMELRFQNGALILKWSFDLKIELRFRNEAPISKSSFDFEMELRFWNGGWVFHVSFCTEKRHVIWVQVFLHLSILCFLSRAKQFTSQLSIEEKRKEMENGGMKR